MITALLPPNGSLERLPITLKSTQRSLDSPLHAMCTPSMGVI